MHWGEEGTQSISVLFLDGGEPKAVHVARCLGFLISSVTQDMARGRLREGIGIPSVHLTTYMELGFQHQGSVGQCGIISHIVLYFGSSV